MLKEWIEFYNAVYDAQSQTGIVKEQLTQLVAHIDVYVSKLEKRETNHFEEFNKIIILTKEAVNALAHIGGAINGERSEEHKVLYVKKVIAEFMALLERCKD